MHTSRQVARAALIMALSEDQKRSGNTRPGLPKKDIKTAAMDYGGDFISPVNKIVERTVVTAKREAYVIKKIHVKEGSVAGATREDLSQIVTKTVGLNVGGKTSIARSRDHISVAVFFRWGLLHLDDVAVRISHRAVLTEEKDR